MNGTIEFFWAIDKFQAHGGSKIMLAKGEAFGVCRRYTR